MTDPQMETASRGLSGRRILLVCPRFFSYEKEIAEELQRRGARVDYLPDRPFASPLFHLIARLWRRAVLPFMDRYYERLLGSFQPGPYDHVFVVNGQTLSPRLVRNLRTANPNARFTFYLWDSLANRRGAFELLPLFDKAFSFEPTASETHGLAFRPLFFSPAYANGQPPEIRHAISFVGTAHTDRYLVVKRIDDRLPAGTPRFWYLYLKARWVLTAMRLTGRVPMEAAAGEFRFAPLSHAENSQIFWQSRCILDIEHPKQEGLTMRTFEALGAGKKLVTTNRNVTRYRLYDPASICVIDRNDPRIPPDFLMSDAKPFSADLQRTYSVAGWVDEIFGLADTIPSHLR